MDKLECGSPYNISCSLCGTAALTLRFQSNLITLSAMTAPRPSRPGLWPARSNVLAQRGLVSHQPATGLRRPHLMCSDVAGNAIDAAITASARSPSPPSSRS